MSIGPCQTQTSPNQRSQIPPSTPSRRTALAGGAIAGGAAWIAPAILTTDAASAQGTPVTPLPPGIYNVAFFPSGPSGPLDS